MSDKEWHENKINACENKIKDLQLAFNKFVSKNTRTNETLLFALTIEKQIKSYSKYLKYIRKRYAFLLEYLENNVYNYEDFEKQWSILKNK